MAAGASGQDDGGIITLSPLDIFHYYKSNTNTEFERKKIFLKGIYRKGTEKEYSGFYYDHLHDPNNESIYLSLKVQSSIRVKLGNGSLYTLGGFLLKTENKTREIGFKLLLNVSDIVEIAASKESEERLKILEKRIKIDEERNKIRNEKRLKGCKSVEEIVERKVLSFEKISIALLCGATESKAEGDIAGELRKLPMAIQNLFSITKKPVSMNSLPDICQCLKDSDSNSYDLICLSRGGGSKEEIDMFNDLNLARTAISLRTPFLATIGHGTDTPFIEEVSDWKEPFNLQPVKIGELLRESAEYALKKESKENELKNIVRQYDDIIKKKDDVIRQKDYDYKVLVKERDAKNRDIESLKDERNRLVKFKETGAMGSLARKLVYIAIGMLIAGIIIGIMFSKIV